MKVIKILLFLFFSYQLGIAQVIVCNPPFPNVNDDITITFDAASGNQALMDATGNIYAHTGVITNLSTSASDWKHVKAAWTVNDPSCLLTPLGNNKYTLSFNIHDFYNITTNETVLKMAFVFRNSGGSIVHREADGSDIFYNVYDSSLPLTTFIESPSSTTQLGNLGDQIQFLGHSSQAAHLQLFENNALIAEANNTTSLAHTIDITATGTHHYLFQAINSSNDTASSAFQYIVPIELAPQDPPVGVKDGLTYWNDSTITLSLVAPNKTNVYVLGDFNNWEINESYQMRKSLDGNTWWLTLEISPDTAYTYQYLVDGTLKIADPLSELILDPSNDNYIPTITYPNKPNYPTGKTSGIVSVIDIKSDYSWQTQNYTKPLKTDLVIYELLIRDFIARHDYQTLIDTLDYLQQLGVNAIELMPVNEFEGNISWGYNPSFHKALDKYYGNKNTFKAFIDECHSRGIAVILDVVFNHAFGQSPLCALYWDSTNNKPSVDNPWLNPDAKHPFNVGYDFNHESVFTKRYVQNCLQFWLSEYKVDGFRFDLSKGFTQVFNTDVGAWGNYDASRIAILKNYADKMWETQIDAYVILEHFANNNEEKELSDYGMMLWGNGNYNYNEATMGYTSNSFSWMSNKARGWNDPHVVAYMESHDEERLMFKNLAYGKTNLPLYSVKDTTTALRRLELANVFFYTIPGPKMLWQFNELGYNYSINTCPNGTINNNCRIDPKPIRWDFYQEEARKRLHDVTAALISLKKDYPLFKTNDYNQAQLGQGYAKAFKLNSQDMNAAILGNFDIQVLGIVPNFQHDGTWYEYFSGDSLSVSDVAQAVEMLPGEYRLYTDVKLAPPTFGYIDYVLDAENVNIQPSNEWKLSRNLIARNETFYLSNVNGVNQSWQINIYSIDGKNVGNIDLDDFGGEQQVYSLQTNLDSGMYFIRLQSQNKTQTLKFIVQ
ncbi:MAG: T9SS type A sorting domain-containing protein [Saprospiraceae bacterium]|nr:T9SS type A sorting domain-containing protein [Saprospiraceae bacterium]